MTATTIFSVARIPALFSLFFLTHMSMASATTLRIKYYSLSALTLAARPSRNERWLEAAAGTSLRKECL